jgi:hypothetical protein
VKDGPTETREFSLIQNSRLLTINLARRYGDGR